MFKLHPLRAKAGVPLYYQAPGQTLGFENVAASGMGRASGVLPETTGEVTGRPQLPLATVLLPLLTLEMECMTKRRQDNCIPALALLCDFEQAPFPL